MTSANDSAPATAPSPIAKLLATGFGLGYLPIASGTWGSLGGVAVYLALDLVVTFVVSTSSQTFVASLLLTIIIVSIVGVWSADTVSRRWQVRDPGAVVIDEIAGQLITYVSLAPLGWKYLVAGFFLFRVFDIWKPFPARQAESLPGGWGIMADDWIAGVYAALALGILRYAGF